MNTRRSSTFSHIAFCNTPKDGNGTKCIWSLKDALWAFLCFFGCGHMALDMFLQLTNQIYEQSSRTNSSFSSKGSVSCQEREGVPTPGGVMESAPDTWGVNCDPGAGFWQSAMLQLWILLELYGLNTSLTSFNLLALRVGTNAEI